MNLARAFFKIFLVLLLFLSLPFVAEYFLNLYEVNRNIWTQPGAIVARGGKVHTGLNRRQYQEIRFRSHGLQAFFNATSLPETTANTIEKDITGRLVVLQDDQEVLAYDFRLDPILKKNIGGLDTEEIIGNLGKMDITQKFDVECRLVGVTPDDQKCADKLRLWKFERGETIELHYTFHGIVPDSAELSFSYSKIPKSFLRGTFLDGFSNWILQLNQQNKKD